VDGKSASKNSRLSSSSIETTMHPSDLAITFRKPVRITITVPHSTHLALADRSDEEGRSLSNLAAYILENALRN
jgi:hypothetical protein